MPASAVDLGDIWFAPLRRDGINPTFKSWEKDLHHGGALRIHLFPILVQANRQLPHIANQKVAWHLLGLRQHDSGYQRMSPFGPKGFEFIAQHGKAFSGCD